MTKEFKDFIDDFLVDELYANAGLYVCGAELGIDLVEELVINNNYNDYSYQEAIDFAFKFNKDALDTFNHFKDYYDTFPNVFESPNKYVVYMIMYGVTTRLSESETVNSFWNKQEELTEDIIKKILKDLDIEE